MSEEIAEQVREALKGTSKRDEQVEALVALILGREQDTTVYAVYPRRTRAEIERVNIYGLEIGVDANGYACRVGFPDGAEFDE